MTFDVGYGAAALAGLLSFLSPCILPIVPFYLGYLAGVSFNTLAGDDEAEMDRGARTRIILSAVLFAAGIVTIFVGLGATATYFGQQLREWFDVLRYVAAGLILVLGLHFLGLTPIAFLNRQARFDLGDHRLGYLGAYLVGMAFAFGWTPCVGPVLAAILFTASGAETAREGAGLLLAYGLGMSLPFVLAALFIGPFMRWAKSFRRYMPVVERGIGVMLIVFAVLIATNSVSLIAEWLLRIAPDIGTLQ